VGRIRPRPRKSVSSSVSAIERPKFIRAIQSLASVDRSSIGQVNQTLEALSHRGSGALSPVPTVPIHPVSPPRPHLHRAASAFGAASGYPPPSRSSTPVTRTRGRRSPVASDPSSASTTTRRCHRTPSVATDHRHIGVCRLQPALPQCLRLQPTHLHLRPFPNSVKNRLDRD
jgi:hypothetical protein